MVLDDDEAKQLEDALKILLPHMAVNLSQRQFDLLIAGEILVEIYGTRALTLYLNKRNKKQAPSSETVFHFPQPGVRVATEK